MSDAVFKNEKVEVAAAVFNQLISGPLTQPMTHWFLLGSGTLYFSFLDVSFAVDICVCVSEPLNSGLIVCGREQ